jgi:hypothetical protein
MNVTEMEAVNMGRLNMDLYLFNLRHRYLQAGKSKYSVNLLSNLMILEGVHT